MNDNVLYQSSKEQPERVRAGFQEQVIRASLATGSSRLSHARMAGELDAREILGWRTPAEDLDEVLRSAQQDGVATTG